MSDFHVPIHIEERGGLDRSREAVRIGVPFPRGLILDAAEVVVTDAEDRPLPHQAAVLSRWNDRTVKWALIDFVTDVPAAERRTVFVRRATAGASATTVVRGLHVAASDGQIHVDTGVARFQMQRAAPGPLSDVVVDGAMAIAATRVRLTVPGGKVYTPITERLSVEESGPLRAVVVAEGSFQADGALSPVRFRSRAAFVAGSAVLLLDYQVRNTRPAVHPGGLWDLGDPGSWLFSDLTIDIQVPGQHQRLRWRVEDSAEEHEQTAREWSVYQDSSGGEQWDSPNHVNARGEPTVHFRGYRVTAVSAEGSHGQEGRRATPHVTAVSDDTWVSVGVRGFWQNFPKALRWRPGGLAVALFPAETSDPFELQGGEQKRHTIVVDAGRSGAPSRVPQHLCPVVAAVDPAWVERSRAILWFTAASAADDQRYGAYVRRVIEGPDTFFSKREIVDEYGWRNFGETYADHEAVRHGGPRPFISHYNNQYDFIFGAFVHFHRTGDARWRELLDDAARHFIDIDIYHTGGDKAAFNGGQFWHTDHYLPAVTATHRAYSRHNKGSGDYGGGPSNENNYTSGLLHYYYLSGDSEAAAAVGELADWVVAMDDGARTMFGIIDPGPTGVASKTLESGYHKAGRGAGNSINALLDAYVLTRQRSYLLKAEELIQRCIHPLDDIAALRLDDPEHRWSYLVFLQVLGKYLATKEEAGERDYGFMFARESLLHYARWIADNEVPYKDVLHKVELPTETWPAHDIRKSHVLDLAASYSVEPERTRFSERAHFFFERCLADLLGFATASLARPLVILAVFGSFHEYFRRDAARRAPTEAGAHNYDFGAPAIFVPQRVRLRGTLSSRGRVLVAEASRLGRELRHSLVARLRRRR